MILPPFYKSWGVASTPTPLNTPSYMFYPNLQEAPSRVLALFWGQEVVGVDQWGCGRILGKFFPRLWSFFQLCEDLLC